MQPKGQAEAEAVVTHMPEPIAELVPSVPEVTPAAPSAPAPETPAPEAPKPEAPAPDAKPEGTPEAEQQLFELPDGRKVDAQTLQKEWKDNFAPEFTRRSQRLAEYEKVGKPEIINKNEPAWKDPNYVPKSYAEVIEIAKAEAKQSIIADAEAAKTHNAAIATEIEGQLTQVKKDDPSLNENALFAHATKYGFQNLKAAHANMKALQQAAIDAEQRTLKNLQTREADPVAVGSGNAIADDSYDPAANSGFANAVEYLRSLTKR